jgi:hypothetical protein
MHEQVQQSFPVVYSLDAHHSDDGATLAVEATCFDKTVVRFAIPVDNIQHLVAFLLVWVDMISPLSRSNDVQPEGTQRDLIPIPARSIAIGEPDGEHAYIGISVGRAELVFSLPASSLGSIGQSLLMASAPVNSPPS